MSLVFIARLDFVLVLNFIGFFVLCCYIIFASKILIFMICCCITKWIQHWYQIWPCTRFCFSKKQHPCFTNFPLFRRNFWILHFERIVETPTFCYSSVTDFWIINKLKKIIVLSLYGNRLIVITINCPKHLQGDPAVDDLDSSRSCHGFQTK